MSTARATAAEPSFAMPSPYVIAIDPGHGGSPTSDPTQLWDPGVVVGSIMEKDITLDLAFRLRSLLQREKVKVVLTRTGDQYVEISERWNRVHAANAQMFVSLHVNAFDGDPSINGAAVFYPKPDSVAFAQAIDAGLAQTLKRFQIADDGVVSKPELWVRSDIPTATVEPAYLTNPRERSLLLQDDFRDAIAMGIFQGMLAADPQIDTHYAAPPPGRARRRRQAPGRRGRGSRCDTHRHRHSLGCDHRRHRAPLHRDARRDPPPGTDPATAHLSPAELSPAPIGLAAINDLGPGR